MGVCLSVDKKSDSVLRDRLDVAPSKAETLFVASSAMSAVAAADAEAPVGFFRSPGSKEDMFFDSQGWIDSDCEDEFFSMKGDFTPSRGSTPNHRKSAPFSPRLDNEFLLTKLPDSKSEPRPTVRKTLADLLYETLQSELAENSSNAAGDGAGSKFEPVVHPINSEPKSLDGTPQLSGANSSTGDAMTPNRDLIIRKEKAGKTGACCLPRLHTKTSPKSSAV